MAKITKGGGRRDLVAILRRLNWNVPAGENEEALPRVPRESSALRQLRTRISADPFAKVLLSGHIGVGKSTEILAVARQMESERFVVRVEVSMPLGVHNVTLFSLLVAVMEALIRKWPTGPEAVPRGLVEELVGQVRSLLPQSRQPPRQPLTPLEHSLRDLVGAKVCLKTGQRRREEIRDGRDLLDLYSEVLQKLALRSLKPEEVQAIDPNPMVSSCRIVLNELSRAAGKPVLLAIDDLDKVRNDAARDDIFLARAMAWQMLPCGIVATFPLDAVFSSLGPELDQSWHHRPLILDPMPVPVAGEGSARDPALQPYLAILRSVNAESVISARQCRRLAHASGGLPRSFVSTCAACISYAIDASADHVQDYHVDLVLADVTDVWRGRLDDSDYQALVDVVDSGGSNVPHALHLLRDGVILRDGGAPADRQFRLAPWAEPLLDAYRERMAAKESTKAR